MRRIDGHMPIFTSISDAKAAELISAAQRRAILAAPALRKQAADALVSAQRRLGREAVRTIVDCDEEVFRLGFGDLQAVQTLRDASCAVQQCAGLRIGVLICDDRAWIFAPTALYVQTEVHSDETPNAVELRAADIERIVWRLSPEERLAAVENFKHPDLRGELDAAETEIGHDSVTDESVERTADGLKVAPPIPFDVARQVRVFAPYIQYVDIQLTGCAIQRRRVEIPKSIRGVGAAAVIEGRLKTTFDLIEKSSGVSSQELERELKDIRDDLTRSLGQPWGRVLLRAVRPRFDQRIAEFRQKLEAHRKTVAGDLAKYLEESRKQVVQYYLPLVKKSPPDAVLGQLITRSPSDEDLGAWLDDELRRVFPPPEDVLRDMRLDVHYRDVTYETLNEDGFADALNKAYPLVDWDKPFAEFNAAKERSGGPPK